MSDDVLKQLEKMSKAELVLMASEFEQPVVLKRTWNKKQVASAIRKRQIKDQGGKPTDDPNRNPEFETACGGGESESVTVEQRGGSRPGAGRPPGITDLKARIAKLPELPNLTIVKFLKTIFLMWSHSQKLPELALDDEDAESLALPYTQLQEYYFPNAIPEIVWVWLSAGVTTALVLETKISLVKIARQKKVEVVEVEKESAKT